MIDYVSIGKRIRQNRHRADMTQETLAEKISVSPPYISRIETGSASPSLQTLVDICNALDITVDDLMQDSLPAAQKKLEGRLGELAQGCTAEELHLVAEVAETVLRNVREIYRVC